MEKQNPIISPSLLASDFSRLGEEVKAAANAGADWIHVDVMDGFFVPNISIGIPVVAALKKISPIPLDVHLMIIQPERHVQAFLKAGADILTIHCENNPNAFATLQEIRNSGGIPAIALNPATPEEMIKPLLPFVDMVLVMTVNPGFGGQKFIPSMIEKIVKIRSWIQAQNLNARIQVDGGINQETLALCANAGADTFVAGTSIFGATQGYTAAISALKQAATPR